MSAANTESAYKEAAQLFKLIDQYQDSAVLAQSCYEKAEVARIEKLYQEAKNQLSLGKDLCIISKFESAIEIFQTIEGYKDSSQLIAQCKELIEAEKKEAEKRAKRIKKIAIITTPIVCAIITFIIVLNTVIIPLQKKKDFIDTYGIELYQQFGLVEKGAYITFGAYEQDNNTANGKEDVEWLVLEVKYGKALVISKYALDCQQYNTEFTDVTWETCTLRKWLNNDFINVAFSAEEKAMIPTVTVSADKNPDYITNPGNATQDQVFLLSITEVNKYFSSDSARQCKPTDYAVANGAVESDSGNFCWWWLRSPGIDQSSSARVVSGGGVDEYGIIVFSDDAVRPAMWIDLSKIE